MTARHELSAPGGRSILFIHGMLHGSWCWSEPWREYFRSRGISTHVGNLPGHGGLGADPSSQRWASLNEYADAVVQMVAGYHPTPILVGHSLGALLIQMRLRELNPPAVVLLAPTDPTGFRWSAWNHFRRDPGLFLRVHRQRAPLLAIPTPEACRERFFSDDTPDRVVDRCFGQLEEESYRVCLELLLRPKVVWRAHTDTPVLVLGAGQDRSVPRRVTERVARVYGVQAEFFEETGHDLMLEPGWQRVAERIVAWLRELRLATRRGLRIPAPQGFRPWSANGNFPGHQVLPVEFDGPPRRQTVEVASDD
jgi:hypothetical protein